MHSIFRKRLIFIFFLGCFSWPTQGQINRVGFDDLSAPIAENSRATHLDLIDLVFPETPKSTRKSIPLKNIFGNYRDRIYDGVYNVAYVRTVRIKKEGRRLLMLMNLTAAEDIFDWPEMNVLALFDLTGSPKLLDAVDVQADRSASFFEPQPILKISPQVDAFLIVNRHFNSGESFTNLTLVGIVHNRFKIILDDIPTLKTENPCGFSYEEKAALKTVPKAGKNYRDIRLDLRYVKTPDGKGCGRKASGYTKISRRRYAWNEQRKEYIKLREKK